MCDVILEPLPTTGACVAANAVRSGCGGAAGEAWGGEEDVTPLDLANHGQILPDFTGVGAGDKGDNGGKFNPLMLVALVPSVVHYLTTSG
jgi:hypothetical protein